jgi:hypothetical protein
MSWNEWEENFMWYKIIRSQDNPDPVYPEDGHMYYSDNVHNTEYVDRAPLPGKTFYRVCVITHEKQRYCSNVVTIDISERENEENYAPFCPQVITLAKNSTTGECKTFSTPCDVPEGWEETMNEDECHRNTSDISSFSVARVDSENGLVYFQWSAEDIPAETTGVALLKNYQDSSLTYPEGSDETFIIEDVSITQFVDEDIELESFYFYRICAYSLENSCIAYSEIIPFFVPPKDELLPEEEEIERSPNGEDTLDMLEEENISFLDVSIDDEVGMAILEYANKGVVQGFSDGYFRPEKYITRAELAKISTLAEGGSPKEVSQALFCDVPVAEWFAPFVHYFFQNGYAQGFPGGGCSLERFFSPHNPVLRAEAGKMILEVTNIDVRPFAEGGETGFSDVPSDHWFAPYAKTLKDLEIFRDIDGEIFRPNVPATRGEVMHLLYRTQLRR